ncbi:hypothetical protein [Aphanothece sacrum]|uniref:Uncharacterized protein n=1 Tax=Aphanothece sacrum FPU1 TaxID=1920663 RepID=A0A401IKL6_APHSA|nr:hypothetical protein [Aphanothece sacrum]GBF81819.1 hypothetical protein AsFPU1_3240 [Aphanothece sacrum FPU1]GBF84351.1 hypothetical protein AsFPU3_1400 [Aphanothece sacrum FPU3]
MEYRITVEFDSATVSILNENKYRLIYFISSSSINSCSAIPLCYGVVDRFLTSLEITFKDNLFAYVSSSPLVDQQEIYISQTPTKPLSADIVTTAISSSCPISLGQTLNLNSDLTVNITTNLKQNIGIQSETTDQFTSGIGIIDNSNPYYRGINAQLLYKTLPLQLTPGSKILLAIMPNNSIKINMAVTTLNSACIVIDLSENPTPSPNVTYSLQQGWTFNDPRVTQYRQNTELRAILIT